MSVVCLRGRHSDPSEPLRSVGARAIKKVCRTDFRHFPTFQSSSLARALGCWFWLMSFNYRTQWETRTTWHSIWVDGSAAQEAKKSNFHPNEDVIKINEQTWMLKSQQFEFLIDKKSGESRVIRKRSRHHCVLWIIYQRNSLLGESPERYSGTCWRVGGAKVSASDAQLIEIMINSMRSPASRNFSVFLE